MNPFAAASVLILYFKGHALGQLIYDLFYVIIVIYLLNL
ncbi:MAG: hypothetical protein ACI9WL_000757 [Rubritalea sp.]|jgi:hypothetical protein